MEFRAVQKWEIISPVKARLVADNVRGLDVQDALEILMFMPQKAAKVIYKTVASALANAEHIEGEEKPDVDRLYIKGVTVDTGPVLKRISYRAYGRANRKRRRTSHITVLLAERELKDTELEEKKEHRTPFFRRRKKVKTEAEEDAVEVKPEAPKRPKRPRKKGKKKLSEAHKGKRKSVQKRPEE
jgi:large subunit ribosomal protein L22